MNVRRYLGARLLIFLIGSALLSVACVSQPDESAVSDEDEPVWSALRVLGEDAEVFDSFDRMSESADIVALGSITQFDGFRLLQGDAEEDKVFYGQATFEISEKLTERGDAGDSSVTMEFLLNAFDSQGAQAELDKLNRELDLLSRSPNRDESTLVFLRDKGGSEKGLYRPINSLGVWTNGFDGLVSPLTFDQDDGKELRSSLKSEVDSVVELAGMIRQD